ncbi:hypothetical protein ACH49_12105 [Streptomyces leeuwenhoekii]|uniref:Uncharacterized protein n=1 Tax=Streptomyces leeuwenhoekii TaxID=1437453 RepID=A0ABR5I005_STRLW|nr:hypothetical protein [Streptomyces leeuwenhoekii]KMS79568.1 hypothetical protein ACH49_12105 [Streptomyces leeuwenhoekii]
MADQPVEARCDHCEQLRPLFLYEPDHNVHLIPVPCEWCERDKQPLLCVRCYSAEREREENAPMSADEEAATAFFIRVSRNNARIIAQQEADKAACEAIARATEQAEGSTS